DLTLTSRNKGDPDEVPMAGVPYHAAHGYIARLLPQGHKGAICEQLGDPSKIRGIVPRQVGRVITPGLITDPDQPDARSNHQLAAVDAVSAGPEATPAGPFGLALLDLSTGELSAASIADTAALLAELSRADPREALFGPGLGELQAATRAAAPRAVLRQDDALEDAELDRAIDEATPEPLAAEARASQPLGAVRAAGRVLRFARRCTP